MKFEPCDSGSINGTCLQGYVDAPYSQLLKVFGEPQERMGDKSSVEWFIRFEDGTVATIYDYTASEFVQFLNPETNTNWHIGGFEPAAVDRVKEALSN